MSKKSKSDTINAADAIDALVIAALNVLDAEDLTPWQRHKADEIYDLAGHLETGEPTDDGYDDDEASDFATIERDDGKGPVAA